MTTNDNTHRIGGHLSTPDSYSNHTAFQNNPEVYQERERSPIHFSTSNTESLLASEAKMHRWQIRRKNLIWKVLRALRRAVSLRRMAERFLDDGQEEEQW